MKKTVFLVVLAVLALGFVIVPAEAKIDTMLLHDGNYQITETPDIPFTKTIIPPPPTGINLSPSEIEQAYLSAKAGQVYPYTKKVFIMTSTFPPTFQTISQSFELSLLKNKDGALKWQPKEGSKNIEAPAIDVSMTILLIIIPLGTLLGGVYDRRFGERKTILLLIFYFLSILPSVLWLLIEREPGSFNVFLLNLVLPIAAAAFLASLFKIQKLFSFTLAVFTMAYLGAGIFFYSITPLFSQVDEIVYLELVGLLSATVIASFLIGEGWYRYKKRNFPVGAMPQIT